MKKARKVVALALILCLALSGCGQQRRSQSKEVSDALYAYRSQPCSVEGMDEGFAMELTADGTWIYAVMAKSDAESGGVKKWFTGYRAEDGEAKRVETDGAEKAMLLQIAAGEDGAFWGVLYQVEAGVFTEFSVNQYDENGKVLSSKDLAGLLMDETGGHTYGHCVQIGRDGSLYLAYADGGNSVLSAISQEGQVLFRTGVAGTVERTVLADDGHLYAAVKREEDTLELLSVDARSGESRTLVKNLPQNMSRTLLAVSTDGKKLYYNALGDLYEYSVTDGESRRLFALADMRLAEEELVGVVQVDEEHFYFLSNVRSDTGISRAELTCVSRASADEAVPVQDKEALKLAVFAEDDDVNQAVAWFNRQSNDCKIEICLYSGLDETDGADRLQADIASGKIPDLIDLAGVDGMTYIRQGIVADLTPLLEQDPEISESDFVENAVSTYRYGEGLYAIPTIFWLDSLVGKTSCLGGRTGWTLEEFREYADALPDPGAATAGASKEEMFNRIMIQYAERYIDWENGTCSFDSGEFLELLEFVNRFPDHAAEDEEQIVDKIRADKMLLYPTTMNCALAFQLNQAIFGEETTYIGFPSESGSGSKMMIFGNAFGISQNCKNKDAAWAFLKSMYTSDSKTIDGFPTYKASLEKAFDFASMGTYRTDENGVRTEQPKYELPYGGLTFEIYAATEEEIGQLRSLIENAEPADIRTPGIYAILQEEASAFFEGQRSAAEAADIMQSRVALYINERR